MFEVIKILDTKSQTFYVSFSLFRKYSVIFSKLKLCKHIQTISFRSSNLCFCMYPSIMTKSLSEFSFTLLSVNGNKFRFTNFKITYLSSLVSSVELRLMLRISFFFSLREKKVGRGRRKN